MSLSVGTPFRHSSHPAPCQSQTAPKCPPREYHGRCRRRIVSLERKGTMISRPTRWLFAGLLAAVSLSHPIVGRAEDAASATPTRSNGLEVNFIDSTANPCVDFFQYACGNFSRLHPIPADRSAFGA